MKDKKRFFKYTKYSLFKKIFIPCFLFLGFFSSYSLSIPRFSSTSIRDNPKEIVDQVWQIIFRDFLDSSGSYNANDWIETRRNFLAIKYSDFEEAYLSIRNMLENLNDPYTRFLDPKEFNEMRIDTTGELMGVGIQISLDDETNNIVVVSAIDDSPAFKAGIKSNDVIKYIDGKTTQGMSIDNVVRLIRGESGSKVELGILREGKLINISLLRERITINAVTSRLNTTNKGIKIGYIRLKQFNANSPREMRDIINKLELEEPFGYVLDLRSNPGGLLEASVQIARQWVDKGIIVSTKTRDGISDIRRANGRSLTQRPVVLLINEGSASASEILSGAIQDNKRGILVGKKTFGKGLVQSVRSLPDGSGLTVTVAKYLTPMGKDINKDGIYPDVESEQSLYKGKQITISDLGTFKDSQYMAAQRILIRMPDDISYYYFPNNLNNKIAFSDFTLFNIANPCQFSCIHTNQE